MRCGVWGVTQFETIALYSAAQLRPRYHLCFLMSSAPFFRLPAEARRVVVGNGVEA